MRGNAMGVRGLVKGQKNSHSGLLGKVGETTRDRCILKTILHTHVDHAFNVERISFFPPVALSISLTLLSFARMPRSEERGASLLRDTSSLVRLFHSRPSSSSPPTHPPSIFSLSCVARKSVAPFSEYRLFSVLSVG